jgi:outer membrane protein assembly factor BamB
VYVFFGKSGVIAFDLDGRQLWQTDVGQESGRQGFGSAASLVLHKATVIVNAAEESRSLRALDKATGRERWRADGTGFANVYNTPLQHTLPDGQQELVVALQNTVRALDPDTGKERWFATVPITGNLAASIIAADGVLYAFSGNQRPGTAAIRTGGTGDVTNTHVLWTSRLGPDFGTPVLHGGYMYFATSRGVAVCLDAKTGAEVYQERLEGGRGGGRTYASPILADGKLFLATRGAGTLVIAAKPTYQLLARNVVAGDPSDFSATPMVAGREIILRSNYALYCFAEADGARAH